MKKIVIVLLAVMFIGSAVFAQTTQEKKSVAEKTTVFVGKVVDVTVANPAKGLSAGAITVADETGTTTTFTVKSTAKILTHTLDVITLNKLKIGEKVKINASKENEGLSIKEAR